MILDKHMEILVTNENEKKHLLQELAKQNYQWDNEKLAHLWEPNHEYDLIIIDPYTHKLHYNQSHRRTPTHTFKELFKDVHFDEPNALLMVNELEENIEYTTLLGELVKVNNKELYVYNDETKLWQKCETSYNTIVQLLFSPVITKPKQHNTH